jgi:hypothetical protein
MSRFESNSTPLAANTAYEGGTIYTGRSDHIVGAVYSDQFGELFVEQSTNNTNWDISTKFTVTANVGQSISEEVFLPYARVRFENGATAQGAFRIYVRLSSAGPR